MAAAGCGRDSPVARRNPVKEQSDRALTKLSPGNHFGFQQWAALIAEVQPFTRHDLLSRTNQCLPELFLSGQATRQQHLNTSLQELPRRRVRRTQFLCMAATAMPEQPCGKHLGVIENHQVRGMQQLWKVAELPVFEFAALQMQQS